MAWIKHLTNLPLTELIIYTAIHHDLIFCNIPESVVHQWPVGLFIRISTNFKVLSFL